MPCSPKFSITLQTKIVSTDTLDFLKHMIVLVNSVLLEQFLFIRNSHYHSLHKLQLRYWYLINCVNASCIKVMTNANERGN